MGLGRDFCFDDAALRQKTNRNTERQASSHTYRHTHTEIDRQTDRNTHTEMQTYTRRQR